MWIFLPASASEFYLTIIVIGTTILSYIAYTWFFLDDDDGDDGLTDFQRRKLAKLSFYDVVVIIDDSPSMTSHWGQTRDALRKLVKASVNFDKDGINVFFLNTNKCILNCKRPKEIMKLFKAIKLNGTTPLGENLQYHVEKFLTEYEDEMSKTFSPGVPHGQPVDHLKVKKPAIFLVLTDGIPDDKVEVSSCILNAIDRLDELGAPEQHFGIQFVQVGNDPGATTFLNWLDNNIGRDRNKSRDIVDTIKYDGMELDLVKVLLGAVDKKIDERNPLIESKS